MAEINPFETNTVDIWAQFEADESRLHEKFNTLHALVTAHHMDTSFRPQQLWSFPTNVGWVRMLGYVKQQQGRQPVEHLVINIEHGDSIDYDTRGVEVRDYLIDFEQHQLAKKVTDVEFKTSRESIEVPEIKASSGPVIDYHNLNCEVTCGTSYNEAAQQPQFDGSNIYELNEIIALLDGVTSSDAVMTYHEGIAPGA
jgi:hypothetical protein